MTSNWFIHTVFGPRVNCKATWVASLHVPLNVTTELVGTGFGLTSRLKSASTIGKEIKSKNKTMRIEKYL